MTNILSTNNLIYLIYPSAETQICHKMSAQDGGLGGEMQHCLLPWPCRHLGTGINKGLWIISRNESYIKLLIEIFKNMPVGSDFALFHHTKTATTCQTQIFEQDSSDLNFTSSVGQGYIYSYEAAFCLCVLENVAGGLSLTRERAHSTLKF